MALSSKLDAELVTGAGGLAGTGGLANPTDPTADVDYAGYVALASSMVDGLYADTVASVRLLFSSRLYKHALATYRAGTTSAPATGETSALERLMQLTGGVRATSQISDSPTSGTGADIETVIGARATGLIHMVQPIWSGPTMIVDDVTRADEGELVITLVGLFAQKIVRAAGFLSPRNQAGLVPAWSCDSASCGPPPRAGHWRASLSAMAKCPRGCPGASGLSRGHSNP